ncbi:hypothetical protein N2152v2_006279 [Parachlorella kessleri]
MSPCNLMETACCQLGLEKAGKLSGFVKERWRRIKAEFVVELPLLRARWKQVLFGALFQYVHGITTQLAHRMHRPQEEPLHDLGFAYLPELGKQNAWVSETIFWCLFIPFILWSFSPFVTARKRFYTAVTYARLLMVLATHGCGDLIFSSHTTFVLVGCLTYTEYGSLLIMKIVGWLGVAAMSLCIVMSRKHYTVDVVVAWYTVPLVFYAMHRRWTTKRPVQDYWPHRPIQGEESVELQALDVEADDDDRVEAAAKQPLLPIVAAAHARSNSNGAGTHNRSGSRTPSEVKNGVINKQLLKEPLSPPAAMSEDPEMGQPLRHTASNHNMRPRNILQAGVVAAGADVELAVHREDSPRDHRQSGVLSAAVAAAAAAMNPLSKTRLQ